MSVIITDQASTIEFLYSNGDRKVLDKDNLNIKEENNIFNKWVYISNSPGFIQTAENDVIRMKYQEVTSPALASNQELIDLILLYKASSGYTMGSVVITDGTRTLTLEPNGSIPVTLQDQTTPSVIAPMSILEETTTTTAPIAIDDYVIPVTSATGIAAGKMLSLFDPDSIRFSTFFVVSVASLNITVDRPLDFAYPAGSYVDVSEVNLAVNGSGTPVIAGLRNNAGAVPPPGIALSMDVTRVLFHCIATSACDLTTFGNLTSLTNGVVMRRRDGNYYNIFNCKSNGEFKEIMFDFDIVATGTVGQGEDGFFGRLTFGGQSKMGVVQRIAIDEDIEIIIQDNISALTLFQVTAEGSIVQP
jgi:hypothetical protein